jgi:hypothetical protein
LPLAAFMDVGVCIWSFFLGSVGYNYQQKNARLRFLRP